MERNLESRIEMAKNGGGSKQDFETFKSILCGGSPFERGRTLGTKERRNWQGYTRVTINETAVKIGKSKKYLDIGNRAGNWPIGDRGYASGVHRNTFWRDDESEKADFLNMELAFFEFDVQ